MLLGNLAFRPVQSVHNDLSSVAPIVLQCSLVLVTIIIMILTLTVQTRDMNWSRVADLAQRSLSVTLLGLSLYGVAVLAQGGYIVVKKRKQRKTMDASQQVALLDGVVCVIN